MSSNSLCSLAINLATTLKGQTIQNQVREVGINPNYRYAVAWAEQLKAGQVIPVVIWQQASALYRDAQGQVHTLENVCPQQGVEPYLTHNILAI